MRRSSADGAGKRKIRIRYATALADSGKPAEALEEIKAALSQTMNKGEATELRGSINFALGKTPEALDDYSEAIRLGIETPRVYDGRGAVYEKMGSRPLALADYRKSTSLEATASEQRKARLHADERVIALEAGIAAAEEARKKNQGKPADYGLRIALVIGVGAYENVPSLANPPKDAHAMAELLRRLGFAEVVEVSDPNRAAMEEALKTFTDKAASADWAVVFYAGHGVQVDGRNFLIPADAKFQRASHVEFEAVALDRVMASAAEAKKLGLVVLDSCRNNPFINRLSQDGKSKRAIGDGLASVEPTQGELVAFSTRDGRVAWDGTGEHSPFTQALLQYAGETGVDIRLMFGKVRDFVMKTTNNGQEPFTYGSLPGEEFYFNTGGR